MTRLSGMVQDAFNLINTDIKDLPEAQVQAYALNGFLSRDEIRESENFAFSVPYSPNSAFSADAEVSVVLEARPKMKRISLMADGNPQIID